MLARARVLIPPDPAGSVVGGTFHSVAYQLICRHSAALGLPTKFSVADAADAAQLGTASVVQASGCRRDVTVFRLNAACAGDSGFEPTFRRNTAAPVYPIEAAHNPEVAGSNPAPATHEGPGNGAFLLRMQGTLCASASTSLVIKGRGEPTRVIPSK